MEPLLLTITEAARELRVSRAFLYRLIAEKRVSTVSLGRRRLVRPEALLELVNRSAAA